MLRPGRGAGHGCGKGGQSNMIFHVAGGMKRLEDASLMEIGAGNTGDYSSSKVVECCRLMKITDHIMVQLRLG